MGQDGIPPVIGEPSGAESYGISRVRWWVHLIALGVFPLIPGVLGLTRPADEALLPKNVSGLLRVSVLEVVFFAIFFGIAWSASRVNASQLLLRWRRGGWPVVLGFAYSIGLRMAVLVVVGIIALLWQLVSRVLSRPQDLQKFRPQIEHLMNTQAILHQPIYLFLCVTLISFVVGGLREEIWRSAMFAGMKELFPREFEQWSGKIASVLVVAVLFGFGHTAQGAFGVMMASILGLGLGAIMLAHRSIWEAVIAHGFFDASTFVALYVLLKYFPDLLTGQ